MVHPKSGATPMVRRSQEIHYYVQVKERPPIQSISLEEKKPLPPYRKPSYLIKYKRILVENSQNNQPRRNPLLDLTPWLFTIVTTFFLLSLLSLSLLTQGLKAVVKILKEDPLLCVPKWSRSELFKSISTKGSDLAVRTTTPICTV